MLAHVTSAAVQGIDSYVVRVEVAMATGLPAFTVVGLPQGAVREGRERVGSALREIGLPVPPRRVTVNLAPADVPKDGSALDLPIAVGLLVADGRCGAGAVAGSAFVGELGLDGALRPVRGALSMAARLRAEGVRTLVLPRSNAAEAAVVEGLDVLGAGRLDEVVAHLRGRARLAAARCPAPPADRSAPAPAGDFADVRGQQVAKRALEVAAAGGHNVLMIGPPGTGKTMLARRLPGILPPMTLEERIEATRIHSVAGTLRAGAGLLGRRPFRAPHHAVSLAGLVGGGPGPRPGEVSLAHRGVLFLDELAEFPRHVLEALRQPLEDGTVHLARAHGAVRFPARFLLVAALNPCPCGHRGDGSDRCLCDDATVARYRGRISGPLLDRIDLHLEVPVVPWAAMAGEESDGSSAAMAGRVGAARTVQEARFADRPGIHDNAAMGPAELRRWCRPSRGVAGLLQEVVDGLSMSPRAYHRILKVARTVADLDGADEIDEGHAAEAVHYRVMDRVAV